MSKLPTKAELQSRALASTSNHLDRFETLWEESFCDKITKMLLKAADSSGEEKITLDVWDLLLDASFWKSKAVVDRLVKKILEADLIVESIQEGECRVFITISWKSSGRLKGMD